MLLISARCVRQVSPISAFETVDRFSYTLGKRQKTPQRLFHTIQESALNNKPDTQDETEERTGAFTLRS
jgi:hypothetical protein